MYSTCNKGKIIFSEINGDILFVFRLSRSSDTSLPDLVSVRSRRFLPDLAPLRSRTFAGSGSGQIQDFFRLRLRSEPGLPAGKKLTILDWLHLRNFRVKRVNKIVLFLKNFTEENKSPNLAWPLVSRYLVLGFYSDPVNHGTGPWIKIMNYINYKTCIQYYKNIFFI